MGKIVENKNEGQNKNSPKQLVQNVNNWLWFRSIFFFVFLFKRKEVSLFVIDGLLFLLSSRGFLASLRFGGLGVRTFRRFEHDSLAQIGRCLFFLWKARRKNLFSFRQYYFHPISVTGRQRMCCVRFCKKRRKKNDRYYVQSNSTVNSTYLLQIPTCLLKTSDPGTPASQVNPIDGFTWNPSTGWTILLFTLKKIPYWFG